MNSPRVPSPRNLPSQRHAHVQLPLLLVPRGRCSNMHALRPTMWQLLVLVALLAPAARAWDKDAGLVPPLGGASRTVTVSSNNVNTANILDGKDNTQWQSGACFPTGFISRDEMNPLKNACLTADRCTASAGSTNLNRAFDADFYTGATIKTQNNVARIAVQLPAPKTIFQVYFRGSWGAGNAQVRLISSDNKTTIVAQPTSAVNWVDQVVRGTWENVTEVQVLASAGFTLTELALQGERCFEWATVDMQAVYDVSMIRARWWSPDAVQTSLSISTDGVTWTLLRNDLVPQALPAQELWYAETPLQARYLSIRHMVNETGNWRKVYMWELAAYPAGGRWGPAPPALPRPETTYRQLLGLCSIWGWGSQMFSDSAVKQGVGPLRYNAVASSGRNYQSMVWDVRKPGNDPKWDTMNKTGTDGQWWLDWDREYNAWKGANLPVSVSYQFLAQTQPPSAWSDPYGISYSLGFKFARHFGPTSGKGNVVSFEAGNEPWDYSAEFYTTLLRGFVDGLQAGDPAVKRLPCALQAHDPLAESATGGHYIGARLPADVAPKIDALNLHIYSFFNNATGQRVGVHPEHPGSSMNGLHNMIAWRDANMPGVPIWVTEWGWDAARPGETCGASTECVSQLAQAAYGIRGLSLLARKGVGASHWFFYANDDKCETLFCRSGLRDTASRDFAELPVYRAFKAFMEVAGNATFHAVPVETYVLHVHVLKTPGAAGPTHVLVWRPVAVGEVETDADTETKTFSVGFSAAGVSAAWKLSGAEPGGKEPVALPTVDELGEWTMTVSSIPTLVVLA